MEKQKPYSSDMTNCSPWKFEALYQLRGLFVKQNPPPDQAPTSILLSNQGALGDVFLTTCLIPSLKKKYPKAKIGLLIDPIARAVAKDCPGIDEIHECTPWFCHRDSKWKKLRKRLQFFPPQLDYDWVIQTDPYFRGMGSALKSIPHRTCFATISDRIYFNDIVSFKPSYMGHLLETLGHLECPWPLSTESKDYAIFHIGSSNPEKELPLAFWQDLYTSYQAQGHEVLFTGSGDREKKMIEQIAPFSPTTFQEFLQKINEADHIVTVDTAALHIACLLKKKTYAFFRKHSKLWTPPEGEIIQW